MTYTSTGTPNWLRKWARKRGHNDVAIDRIQITNLMRLNGWFAVRRTGGTR